MISEISSLSETNGTTVKKPTELGQDDFLNLLVTQLTNQDPLAPMDSTQFVTQLAQFSELEGTQEMSKRLQEVRDYLASANNFSAVSLLGKEIEFTGDLVHYETGSEPTISFNLGKEASKVTVTLYDPAGATVRTWTMSDVEAGKQQVDWDGTNQSGDLVSAGTYRFEVTAQDMDKNSVPVGLIEKGTVDKVEFIDGLPYLHVGDQLIGLADIQGIVND